MNLLTSILTSILLLTLTACSSTSATTDNTPSAATADNSRTSLDWSGTYIGTLPCASCEGISTRIRLGKDLHYQLSETYLGKSDKAMLTEGTFTWNTDGNSIILQGIAEGERSTYFRVGENKLTQLDLQGAKIEGSLAANYVLVKQAE